ncbi:glucan biosynthesis protein G [Roseomonas sp. NAR14]|uniref:Glucans biosynthesis protein G n=1 Tax=Roseomonas acroporae TaxID=2937791 RepID=A0A9X1Y9P7_9PROT|nr:glucan biosynthesis protein G [Roseomonas acroporae]MCK8785707.1 glucan biosynthesis protein G [Roseomonas acroporae]
MARRRDLVLGSLAAPLLAAGPRPAPAQTAGGQQAGGQQAGGRPDRAAPFDPAPFDPAQVRQAARDLAAQPYRAPDNRLPGALNDLDYDAYRKLRFIPGRALWGGSGLPFSLQFFHRGFLYKDRVDLHEVHDGRAEPIRYDPTLFEFGDLPRPTEDLGFAGFRIHYALNRPDYQDEVAAFLGASYFRAVAKGQGYGLSARGLAIRTAEPQGEEFPAFRAFWIERPRPGAGALVVHALLDSPSAAAAYRFTIRPGQETVFDVESVVFPRVEIAAAGIAPLTSMFFFDPSDRVGVDDFRPAVHDSHGLMLATGGGDQIWRPLANPRDLQVSAFADANPRGFGLLQRKRRFADYDDLEARYERRPSLWVEPIGDWGEGFVHLVEIPTVGEIHDNIVAAWRPKQPLKAKGEHGFTYRLRWCAAVPGNEALAQFTGTASGVGGAAGTRLFVLEAAGKALNELPPDAQPALATWSSKGEIRNPVALRNPETGGWRLSFELAPGGERLVELRAQLMLGERPLTETWLYRWTPQ